MKIKIFWNEWICCKSCAMKLSDTLFICCTAIPLSIDHKPDRSDERERIEQAGGFIIWAGKIH